MTKDERELLEANQRFYAAFAARDAAGLRKGPPKGGGGGSGERGPPWLALSRPPPGALLPPPPPAVEQRVAVEQLAPLAAPRHAPPVPGAHHRRVVEHRQHRLAR